MNTITQFQIGKAGLTAGVADSLALAFKNHKTVRISVLKSSGRDRESIRLMADELCQKLPGTYAYKIIGFTIVMQKRSNKKPKKE